MVSFLKCLIFEVEIKTFLRMRKLFLLPVCTLLLSAIFFTDTAKAEESGVVFRDIDWGAHLDSIEKNGELIQFQKVNNSRSSNAYKIPGDDMRIGTVELNELHYIFNEDDRFIQVYMEAGMSDRSDMRFILRHRFGDPDEIREMIRIKMHEWDLGDVQVSMTEYDDQDMFSVTFKSRWDQSEAYRINTNIDDF